MKLLRNSNGIYKVPKEKVSVFKVLKFILIIIAVILSIGVVLQIGTDFINNTKFKSDYKYIRIDGKKNEYNYKGKGSVTVILDGCIGTTMYQWNGIIDKLKENKDISIFTYNRQGYGYNDGGDKLTPKEQAMRLKTILKKSGVSKPYIIVGEGYGSLVGTNFANEYPDEVGGMVLINPINEKSLKEDSIKKEYKKKYLRAKIEECASNIYLTHIINDFNLSVQDNTAYKSTLSEVPLAEFSAFENTKKYRQAVANEYKALCDADSDSQNEGVLKGKPVYILTDEQSESLEKLTDPENLKVNNIEKTDELSSKSYEDDVVDAINSVSKQILKELRKNS
ncbi:alpha/beta hydrolase [Clostridium sp. BJN0001]|uniref:alpha/beta fold hydrolase n=1 Tax=Clostridium sp. BJN0001 TaxID=2930219 RepID=UPI001FD1E4A5|nr:alpha/beta hydrolase [Clostridium sp. BJN0001]